VACYGLDETLDFCGFQVMIAHSTRFQTEKFFYITVYGFSNCYILIFTIANLIISVLIARWHRGVNIMFAADSPMSVSFKCDTDFSDISLTVHKLLHVIKTACCNFCGLRVSDNCHLLVILDPELVISNLKFFIINNTVGIKRSTH
jgi:hypothetical protein